MNITDYSSPLLTFGSTIVVCFLSAIVPMVNAELFVVFLGSVATPALLPALVVTATLAHMAGKSVMYVAGASADRLPDGRFKRRIMAAHDTVQRRPNLGLVVVFLSALVGVPPFYVVSVVSGVLRFAFGVFFLAGLAGRLLRFTALIYLPYLARFLAT